MSRKYFSHTEIDEELKSSNYSLCVSALVCFVISRNKRNPSILSSKNLRESHSLFSLHVPTKLHQAYEIFLPPVQRLVRACIQLQLWL